MKKKVYPIDSNFQEKDEVKASIALNIENFLKNHVNEGATGSQQNMAARRDSWNPLIMKDVSTKSANPDQRV